MDERRLAYFDRYWGMGRAKLDTARVRSLRAVQAADSALACTADNCAATLARVVYQHMNAASGAAREAESLVRIAMYYAY
jgi:hypothetical protein